MFHSITFFVFLFFNFFCRKKINEYLTSFEMIIINSGVDMTVGRHLFNRLAHVVLAERRQLHHLTHRHAHFFSRLTNSVQHTIGVRSTRHTRSARIAAIRLHCYEKLFHYYYLIVCIY